MLSTLALLPEVQNLDAAACAPLFQELRQNSPFNSAILACTAAGNLVASSPPSSPGINLADRKHVKDAISMRDFSAGEFMASRISGVISFNYAFPILDTRKKTLAPSVPGLI